MTLPLSVTSCQFRVLSFQAARSRRFAGGMDP
jgi:hypothetical protein